MVACSMSIVCEWTFQTLFTAALGASHLNHEDDKWGGRHESLIWIVKDNGVTESINDGNEVSFTFGDQAMRQHHGLALFKSLCNK